MSPEALGSTLLVPVAQRWTVRVSVWKLPLHDAHDRTSAVAGMSQSVSALRTSATRVTFLFFSMYSEYWARAL